VEGLMQKGNKKHKKHKTPKPLSIENELDEVMAREIRDEIDKEIMSSLRNFMPVAFNVGIS
jgi:hypothetical protein